MDDYMSILALAVIYISISAFIIIGFGEYNSFHESSFADLAFMLFLAVTSIIVAVLALYIAFLMIKETGIIPCI